MSTYSTYSTYSISDSPYNNTHPNPTSGEVVADTVDVTGGGLGLIEAALVGLGGLLFSPPLAILAVVVIVPAAAVFVLFAAAVGVIAVPTTLVRRVRTHHREHGRTVFLHRLSW